MALGIAVLTADLTTRQIIRRARNCQAIAGAVPLLRDLAEAVEAGDIALPPLDGAVIAYTGTRHGELTDLERDLFWQVFQVPVFEEFRAPDGRLIARECDAHEGLHLVDPHAHRPDFDKPCGCGDSSPRIASPSGLLQRDWAIEDDVQGGALRELDLVTAR